MKQNRDKSEWLRWMKRPSKKKQEPIVKDIEPEKVYLAGDYDLFVELCSAEQKIKQLQNEIKTLKEKINNESSSISATKASPWSQYGYILSLEDIAWRR